MTRSELANRCGVCLRHLASIEAGANFTVALLLKIETIIGPIRIPPADMGEGR